MNVGIAHTILALGNSVCAVTAPRDGAKMMRWLSMITAPTVWNVIAAWRGSNMTRIGEEILKKLEESAAWRASAMPTEQDAVNAMFDAWLRFANMHLK